MKVLNSLIILFCIAIAISSCSHNNNNNVNCINTFPYLANNHKVHYSITTNLFFSDTGQDVTFNTTTSSDVFMATSVSDQGTLNFTEYYHPCNNNLYIGTSIAGSQSDTAIDQKSNTTLNTSWSENFNGTISNYKVIAKNVSVTVPAGTFLCDVLTYQQTGAFNVDTIFTNSSVGYVKYSGFELAYQLLYKNF